MENAADLQEWLQLQRIAEMEPAENGGLALGVRMRLMLAFFLGGGGVQKVSALLRWFPLVPSLPPVLSTAIAT